MRHHGTSLARLCAAVVLLAACKGGGSSGPHPAGAESFLSPAPGGQRSGAGGGATVDAQAGAVPAAPSEGSAARTVEEADIYRQMGSTLLVLSAYRGLLLVDLTDPASPRLLARVPVTGTPVDLYLRGTVAFVAVSDAFTYALAVDGSAVPRRGSRLVAVDVSQPSQPAVLGELAIDGALSQTRLVGDVLYTVSRNTGWYDWVDPAVAAATSAPLADTVTVASFDVRDPAHPAPVARLELPASGWDTHASVTPERITLALAGWEQTGQSTWGPVTRFHVVDISDPQGALVRGTEFSQVGLVQDRWAMDYDAGTGLFRAVATSPDWNGGAVLDVWTSARPDEAAPLSHLAVQVRETLTAARFDGTRVYLVTALTIDPLWVIDASNPAAPRLVGQLEMPGQLDFIEPRGDRLVALGHTAGGGAASQLAVSLFDVANPALPVLRSRVVFGAGFGWVGVQRDDLRKAFLVFDPPPAGIGLVLVPVQGWDPTSYAFTGGTQLIDLSRDALTLRGFLQHPGAVTRAFPADAAGSRLVALSDSALQTIDAADRAAPRELARLDLARPVITLALVRGKAVELCGDWSRGDAELAVTDALDPEAASPLARVDVAAPSARMFQDGDVIWLLASDWSSGKSWLQAVDFADPVAPRLRGRLDLSAADALSFPSWWGQGDEAVLVGHALAIHRGGYLAAADCAGCGATSADQLRLYDLADPDRPRLASTVTLPANSWSWGLQAFGSAVWLTHFEWQEQDGSGRYFVDRVDLADPANPRLLAKVNVPGIFFAASTDGRRLFTLETWWNDGKATTWAHGLELTARGTARLFGSAALQGAPSGAVSGGDRSAWVVTSEWAGGVATVASGGTSAGSGVASSAPGVASSAVGAILPSSAVSHLSALDLGAMAVTDAQRVDGSWAWLRAHAGGKLFVEAGWQDRGLLIYDAADPAHPGFERFVRTQGWVSDIVAGGGYAYLPSGPYGVPMVPLAP